MPKAFVILNKKTNKILSIYDNSVDSVEAFVYLSEKNKDLTILKFEMNPTIPVKKYDVIR